MANSINIPVKTQIDKIKQQQQEKTNVAKEPLIDNKEKLNKTIEEKEDNFKAQGASLITPILMQFIRREAVANNVVDKLKNKLKRQLKNKGTLTVQGNTFYFTPKNYSEWTNFKTDFDKKVNDTKRTISTLEKLLGLLKNILRIINIALSALQVYIIIKRKVLKVKKIALTTEQTAPSPSKPSSGLLIADIIKSENNLKKANDKIIIFRGLVNVIQAFLPLLSGMLKKIKNDLNTLQLILVNDNIDTSLTISNSSPIEELDTPTSEEYINIQGKSYNLILVTLPNGARQYQALDSFSKLKITQTAPSKIATNEQLLEEIKQILG